MVMGMSAETFWGGKDGASQFEQFMGEISNGLKVSTGAQAAQAALNKYGAKKIGKRYVMWSPGQRSDKSCYWGACHLN